MASDFLRRKAAASAASVEKNVGKGAYGSTTYYEKKEEERKATAPKSYSDAVTMLRAQGDDYAAGIMTEHEWQRRRGKYGGTYQDYLYETTRKPEIYRRNIGFDTIDDDIASSNTLIDNAYGSWQDADTMSSTKAEAERMKKRLSMYEEWRKEYGLGRGVDASGLLSYYEAVLGDWDDLSAYYGQFGSKEQYDMAKKAEQEMAQAYEDVANESLEDIEEKIKNRQTYMVEIEDAMVVAATKKNAMSDPDSEYWSLKKEYEFVSDDLDALYERRKLKKNMARSGNVVHKDDFFGQGKANFRLGDLGIKSGKSRNKALDTDSPTAQENALAYAALENRYAKNNEKALDDEGQVLPWFSKNVAGYIPQLKDQAIPKLVGGAIGGAAGFALGGAAGAAKGASVGGGLFVGLNEFDVMRGSVYNELVQAGYDHDTALAAANDEALVSALIEGASEGVDFLVSGGGKLIDAIKGAAKASVAKGTAGAATKFIASNAAKKAAKEVSKPIWRKGVELGGRIIGNTASEYGEEFLQQGTSIANKERLKAGNTGTVDLIGRTFGTVRDAVTGKNPEALSEMHAAGKAGAITGGFAGGVRTVTKAVVIRLLNAKSVKMQNEIIDVILEDEDAFNALIEEGKACGEGTEAARIASQLEGSFGKGTVSRDQVRRLIAANDVYIKNEEEAEAIRAEAKLEVTPLVDNKAEAAGVALQDDNIRTANDDMEEWSPSDEEFQKLLMKHQANTGLSKTGVRNSDAEFFDIGKLGENGKKQFEKFREEVGSDMTEEVLEGFSKFYEAGKNGLTLQQAHEANSYYLENFPKSVKGGGTALLNSAYYSGQNDSEKGISTASRKGDTLEDSSIVLEKDENKYPYNEQEVIEGYEDAVDNRIMLLAEKIRKGQYKENDSVELGKTGSSEIQAVSKILGIDVSGYDSVVEARQIRHIITRHGINGKADKSMRNDEDIARLKFVIDNYDDAFYGGTSSAYTTIKQNGKPREADTVVFAKKINGTYFVVQAVPQTKKKKLFVVSAFISDKTLDEIKEQFFNKKQKNRTSHDASLRQSSKTSVVTSEAAPSENSNDPGVQNQKKDSSSLVGTNSSADTSISENGTDVKRKNDTTDADDSPDIGDIKKATGFGDEGAQLVAELMSKGKSLEEAQKAVKPMYIAGFTGGDVKRAKTDIQKKAFNAGASDKVAQREAARSKAKKATVRDGSLRENEASKKLGKVDREIIKTVAKDLGLSASVAEKIVVASKNGVEYEADARHRDGELTLTGARPVFRLVLHEAGHRMEQFATEEWNTLCEALYERAEQLGRRMDLGVTDNLRFDRVKGMHDKAGITMDTSGYIGEVVMRELETIFSSPKEYNKWLSEISSDRKVKSAWRKFMDFVSGLIGKVRNALRNAGLSKDARVQMKSELAELERIRGLYAEAYRATKSAVEQRDKRQNAKKQMETQKNTDISGGVSFSLKNKNLTANSRIPFVELENYNNVAINDYTALNTLKTKVKALKRGTYQNDATGYKADINSDTIRKAIFPTTDKRITFTKDHINDLNAILKLPELFKNAVYIDSKKPQKEKKHNPAYKEYHHFVSPLFMNNVEYRALITAREKTNSQTLYVLKVEVLPMKKRYTHSAAQQNAVGSQSFGVPFDISISDLVNGVNIYDYDLRKVNTYSAEDIKYSIVDSNDYVINKTGQSVTSDTSTVNNGISHNSEFVKEDFSLKDNNDTARTDTRELLDTIAQLKHEFEITKFAKVDPKKLSEMVRSILKDYSSKADSEAVMSAVDELYTYMANGEDGNPPVWSEVYSKALDIASGIVENAVKVDDTVYREYADLRNYLRNVPMKFDVRRDGVPSGYGNFNEFRKKNFGRLRFSNDGVSVDSVYQELAEMYPQFFDKDNEITTADQLERIAEVLDEIRPVEENPYAAETKEAARYLANDILDRFFDIPQAKPTFADKAERRVVEAKIEGQRKLDRERERRDLNLQKQKEKYRAIIGDVRKSKYDALEREKTRYRQRIAGMTESRKASELRSMIYRHSAAFAKKLVKGTDKSHIPYELQGAVLSFVELINGESKFEYVKKENDHYYRVKAGTVEGAKPARKVQVLKELQEKCRELEQYTTVDPDLIRDGGLLSEVSVLSEKRIEDLNLTELEAVWNVIRTLEASIANSNNLFSASKIKEISEITDKLRSDNIVKKMPRQLKGILGGAQQLARIDMMTPETYLHCLGDAGDEMFRMLHNAQGENTRIWKVVDEFADENLKGEKINRLEKELKTVKLGGKNITLTTAQLMELYVLNKREQAKEHIRVGGILPGAINGKGIFVINHAEPLSGITDWELANAFTMLTDKQRALADKMQEFVSTVLGKYGNEASMQVYNYEKFHEKNYWPIRTNKQEIASGVGDLQKVASVAGKGMAKNTVEKAKNSVCLGSIFETFISHCADMAAYSAWLGTTEDMKRIKNYIFCDDKGNTTGTVKGILDRVHGPQGTAYFEKLLTDIAIGVKGVDNMNPFWKQVGSHKAAAVGANLRVIIQQPTAILRALDMIGVQYLAAGISKVHLAKRGWNRAKKYAPIAQLKSWGTFDIGNGRQMKDIILGTGKVSDKITNFFMLGASAADAVTWGVLWNAVEAETKVKYKGLDVGSEAYYRVVAERFTEIVEHTQVVDGILQRSQIMRSGSDAVKMATSFMGESIKQYNMAMQAVYDVYHSKGNRAKAVKKLGTTAIGLILGALANAAMQSFPDAERDDDKEKKYWEKWWSAFKGDWEDDKWFEKGGNLVDAVNPLNYLPFVKDIVSIVRGYEVKRMDTETIAKTYFAIESMIKAITGTGKNTVAEASLNLTAEVARLFGIPLSNLKREIKSLFTTFALETDNYLMQYHMEKAVLDINFSGNRSSFIDILYNAYKNDREAYEIIYNDLIENGITDEDIKDGMETRMKKAAGTTEVSDLDKRYMSPEDERRYDNKLKQINESDVWKKANEDQRKDAKADLYYFIASAGEKAKKTRKEAAEYGVDETEYVLWQLAKSIADDSNDNNDSMNEKEKSDAIGMLPGLGDSEIAYFYNTEEADKAYENGMDMRNYAEFKGATADLKGKGKESAIADTILQMDVDDDTAWDLYLTKYSNKGVDYALENGIEGNTYLKFIASLDLVDKPTKSGKYGSYTQDEVKNALRLDMFDDLSREEKAVLWQSMDTTWAEKNNPFR